jgi:hypothetical protein
MNKAQRRKMALAKHYAFLEMLSKFLGKKQEGKKLSLKLWKLEQQAHKAATDYCNGDRFTEKEDEWGNFTEEVKAEVEKLFGCPVPGFFVNGDARGYALKIDDEKVRTFYPPTIDFHRDWGGYGILSPEIE